MYKNTWQYKVKKIISGNLPKSDSVIRDGKLLAKDIHLGRTLFFDLMGVSSELEYKEQCQKKGELTFHAHIGMNSWKNTASALKDLYTASQREGFQIHRAGICLDRRMSLPLTHRKGIPAETGPMLETDADWAALGQVVPIQPHMGDFMIGFPNSIYNTQKALSSGVTTIGNLSQYFAHEAPGWRDTITTTINTVKAISILSSFRDCGTLLHSYLEDGFGALFYDCTTIAGWAFLERYIVEELIGARVGHCIGGLTTDPLKRAGWIFALDDIHENQGIGTMIYGDTISFSTDPIINSALINEYMIWDCLAQIECPTGHALLPLPLTEGLRIPTINEIIEAQKLGNRIVKTAQRLHPYIDFSEARTFSKKVVSKGKQVFQRALDGLADCGVDIRDPVALLLVLKKMGPVFFETQFGAGPRDDEYLRGRQPVIATDVYTLAQDSIQNNLEIFRKIENRQMLSGKKLLIASSDVHEHAILILDYLLKDIGVETIYLGAEKNPDEIAFESKKSNVDAVLISTHNGMALDYAKKLQEEMKNLNQKIPILFGGVLNQKVSYQALPINVSSHIRQLGFKPLERLHAKAIAKNTSA